MIHIAERILRNEGFIYTLNDNTLNFMAEFELKKWHMKVVCEKEYFHFYCYYPWEVREVNACACSDTCNQENARIKEGKFFHQGSRLIFQSSYWVQDIYSAYDTCVHGLMLAVSVFILLWDVFYICIHESR